MTFSTISYLYAHDLDFIACLDLSTYNFIQEYHKLYPLEEQIHVKTLVYDFACLELSTYKSIQSIANYHWKNKFTSELWF